MKRVDNSSMICYNKYSKGDEKMKALTDYLINRYGFYHWSVKLFARFVK